LGKIAFRSYPGMSAASAGVLEYVSDQEVVVAELDDTFDVASIQALVDATHDFHVSRHIAVCLAGYCLTARTETLLTPYFSLALRARSEMNAYGFSLIRSMRRPASSIASR
jgi:hypothetical protein